MGFDQIRQRRLSDDIVEQLEGMILEGTLKSGERLPAERALAEQFGVSRPSLREAIQKLSAKGLLVSRQGGGNYVASSLGTTFSDPLLQLLGLNLYMTAGGVGLPVHIVPSQILLITSGALLISFLATLYPAYRATQIRPAEALRYE